MRALPFLLILCLVTSAWADVPPAATGAALVQRLGQQVSLDLPFVDESGTPVTLAQYFHGQPVVLVLAWYRCPGLCSEVQTGIIQCLLELPMDVGRDFQVVTVSIDPTETADLARDKKLSAVQRYGRAGSAAGFHYLTGQKPAIDALCQAVGFHYVFDPATHQYAHEGGFMVVTPEGRVSRYLYGVRYASGALKLALEDASHGRIGTLADKLYLLCFRYDPTSGRYGLAIMRLLRLTGACMAGGLCMFVWRNRHA